MKNRFRVLGVSLLIATISMFVLSTCAEKIVEPEQDAIVIGSIHGVVKNTTTGARLSGVTVTWVSGDTLLTIQSTTTDDLGYFLISGLTSGEYEVSFTGVDAFTEYHDEASIPYIGQIITEFEGDAKGVYYVTTTLNASLYELSSGYKGIVWAKVKDGTVHAASGAEVQFELISMSIAPRVYKGTTGEDGSFSLTSLPAGVSGQLKVLPYNDGTSVFETFIISSWPLSSGETKDAGDIVLTLASDTPFLLSSNYIDATDFDVTAKPTGTFNKAINTSVTEVDLSSYDEDLYTVTWMDDITFTIDPDYPFDVSSSYVVAVSGESQDGKAFNISNWFQTQDGIGLEGTNLMLSEGNPVDNFPLDGNIVLYFTHAVDLEHYNYWLSLTGGIELDVTASGDGKVVTVDPVGNLNSETNYTLTGCIYSTMPGDFVSIYQTFRTTK